MLTPEDLHLARAAGDSGIVPYATLRALLAELDQLPDKVGLAACLAERQLGDAAEIASLARQARAALVRRAESIYAGLAIAEGVPAAAVEEHRTGGVPGAKRLGARLVEVGVIDAERDAAFVARARGYLIAKASHALQQVRDRGFDIEPKLALSGDGETTSSFALAAPSLAPPEKGIDDTNSLFPSLGDPFAGSQHGRISPVAAVAAATPSRAAPREAPGTTILDGRVLPIPRAGDPGVRTAARPKTSPAATILHDLVMPIPGAPAPDPAALDAEAAEIAKVFPAYELEKRLGKGAMGLVYLATEKALKRQVALKVLPGGGDSDAVNRFLREGRAIAALDHPSICPIYNYGEVQGSYFIAMKRIEGKPLGTLEPKQLPIPRAVAIVEQIARALQHAHERGVIHRDVKPTNIMVGADDHAWLVDFGIAKLASEPSITREGEIVGTPTFMSPEQASMGAITTQTDVYSLGAVLYATVCGKTPFDGPNPIAVLTLVATKPPTTPSLLRPDLHPRLEAIIVKAMHKDPTKRYPNAGAFADDLERFRQSSPGAGPAPTPGHSTRSVARPPAASTGAADPGRRLLVLIAVFSGLLAATAVGILVWFVLSGR